MGHYSQFNLELSFDSGNTFSSISELLENNTIDDSFVKKLTSNFEKINPNEYVEELFLSGMNSKWYDNEENMIALSKKYKDIVFKLIAEGEDPGDISESYFSNGKSQVCHAEIVIPPFDKSKLE